MKEKSKNAFFGYISSFLIWGNVISSNKYFWYFLNGIKGIFLGFLSGDQTHVSLFDLLVNFSSTF